MFECLNWITQLFWGGIVSVVTYFFQSPVAVVASLTAAAAWTQIQQFRQFEVLKYLEEPRIRSARRTLYYKLKNVTDQEWWNTDMELEEAAATVCTSFSIVGHMVGLWNYRFFVRNWAHPICWTYEALEQYLAERRKEAPNAYEGFTKLYNSAKRHRSNKRKKAG
ncbi:MAG: hypothetical protein WCA81_01005 [Rhizomicrobium sp.]